MEEGAAAAAVGGAVGGTAVAASQRRGRQLVQCNAVALRHNKAQWRNAALIHTIPPSHHPSLAASFLPPSLHPSPSTSPTTSVASL